MSTTLELQDHAVELASRKPSYLESITANGSNCSADISWTARRWLTRSLPFDLPEGQEPLSLHASWIGPSRLVPHGNGWRQLGEIPFTSATFGDTALDPQRSREAKSLLDDLLAGPLSGNVDYFAGSTAIPSAEKLVGWLSESGCAAAVDDDRNVRFTLKCRGCDGQVQTQRGAVGLRLTMRLGVWAKLNPVAEQAMLHLASEANARGHFMRVAWIKNSDESTCEAQIDLSGIPVRDELDGFWRDLLSAAVRGLELTLRRLGMELDVLANSKNQGLAERLLAKPRQRRRKPR